MNSSVWAVWAAQGSEGKNQFEYFLATFESVFFNFYGQKNLYNSVASALKRCINFSFIYIMYLQKIDQNRLKMNANQIFRMIIFKLIILSPIGAKGYQKIIFETIILSPPPFGALCNGIVVRENIGGNICFFF